VLAVILEKYSIVPLIELYKTKERNQALCNLQTYIHSIVPYC